MNVIKDGLICKEIFAKMKNAYGSAQKKVKHSAKEGRWQQIQQKYKQKSKQTKNRKAKKKKY